MCERETETEGTGDLITNIRGSFFLHLPTRRRFFVASYTRKNSINQFFGRRGGIWQNQYFSLCIRPPTYPRHQSPTSKPDINQSRGEENHTSLGTTVLPAFFATTNSGVGVWVNSRPNQHIFPPFFCGGKGHPHSPTPLIKIFLFSKERKKEWMDGRTQQQQQQLSLSSTLHEEETYMICLFFFSRMNRRR